MSTGAIDISFSFVVQKYILLVKVLPRNFTKYILKQLVIRKELEARERSCRLHDKLVISQKVDIQSLNVVWMVLKSRSFSFE